MKKKIIVAFILGFVMSSVVYASTSYLAKDIKYKETNVEDAMNDLYEKSENKIDKPVLLWTNPSPNSNFNPQTINIDLSSYKYVIITEKQRIDIDPFPRSSVIVPIGDYNNYIMMGNSASYVEKTVRGVKANNSGVTFTEARWGSDSPYYNYNIPLKIYGVKDDLEIDVLE